MLHQIRQQRRFQIAPLAGTHGTPDGLPRDPQRASLVAQHVTQAPGARGMALPVARQRQRTRSRDQAVAFRGFQRAYQQRFAVVAQLHAALRQHAAEKAGKGFLFSRTAQPC